MCDTGAAVRIVETARDEQRLNLADSGFAVSAVLRGKSYELHDARSESLSGDQLQILQATTTSLEDSLQKEIAELERTLIAYCRHSSEQCGVLDVDALGAADCRAALVVAFNLACRFRTAFQVERTHHKYNVMRNDASNKKWEEMANTITELESNAAKIFADNLRLREELRTVKAERDVLMKRLRLCTDMLAKDRRIQPPRNGKKTLDPAAELERSIAAALSQFEATRKKCDMLTGDLNDAKRAIASAQQELSDLAVLKARLRETSEQCAAKDEEIEALETKLRCSICEEREKDAAFACGHTFCNQCATACAKCPLRCEGEHRRKPVKHTFRIYL